MWMAPPSGLRLTSAATTPSVSFVTSSRTRAEAAPWPPLMARNALVIAMVILDGSNATTEPLRRITLYWAKRGSAPLITGLPASPTIRSRGGTAVESVGRALAICMRISPVISCRSAGVCRAFRAGPAFVVKPRWARDSEGRPVEPAAAFPVAARVLRGSSSESLWNQNLLYLVFKCLMSTKHSGSVGRPQAVFHAQKWGTKSTSKTGVCAW